jgi:hypothetical protein
LGEKCVELALLYGAVAGDGRVLLDGRDCSGDRKRELVEDGCADGGGSMAIGSWI